MYVFQVLLLVRAFSNSFFSYCKHVIDLSHTSCSRVKKLPYYLYFNLVYCLVFTHCTRSVQYVVWVRKNSSRFLTRHDKKILRESGKSNQRSLRWELSQPCESSPQSSTTLHSLAKNKTKKSANIGIDFDSIKVSSLWVGEYTIQYNILPFLIRLHFDRKSQHSPGENKQYNLQSGLLCKEAPKNYFYEPLSYPLVQ